MHRPQRAAFSPCGQVRQEAHSSDRKPWIQSVVIRNISQWGDPTLLQPRLDHTLDHAADGPGTPSHDIVYDFENVFDWRSGPRRGLIPAPIPIQSPP